MIKTLIALTTALVALGGGIAAQQATTVTPHAVAAVVSCVEEDGSGAQDFPCYWAGGANGTGDAFYLSAPLPDCELLKPLMAGQGDSWAALPCWYAGDAKTEAFIIGDQPIKGTV